MGDAEDKPTRLGSEADARINLQRAQKMESLAAIAGGVAHDVNNPLNGIINYAELLREEWGATQPDVKQYADRIVGETHRAAQLLRDLFHFIRQDSGKSMLTTPGDLVRGAKGMASATLRHDGISLEADLADDLPALACNQQDMRHVLLSLLINARQAVNERHGQANGEKKVRMQAFGVERHKTPYVCITVEDNGAGMSENVRRQAMDPFFSGWNGTTQMGLGLSVSRQIVEEHDGLIELQSTPEEGTTVHVLLPAEQ